MSAITTVLFDLDGTLLPMDQDVFIKTYFQKLAAKMAPLGYEPAPLMDAVWGGTAAMIQNNGARSNEEVFWDFFRGIYGERAQNDRAAFEEFYRVEFQEARSSCGFNPAAAGIVEYCRQNDLRVILATNPLFPSVATESRIRWAGMEPSDFSHYTTYENSRYCKPNPEYYRQILHSFGLSPEECLMVGNDVDDDMIAGTLGMRVFLLTDCLVNTSTKDISPYPQGDFTALKDYLYELIS